MTLIAPDRLWLLVAVVGLVIAYVVAQRRHTAPAVRHPDLASRIDLDRMRTELGDEIEAQLAWEIFDRLFEPMAEWLEAKGLTLNHDLTPAKVTQMVQAGVAANECIVDAPTLDGCSWVPVMDSSPAALCINRS